MENKNNNKLTYTLEVELSREDFELLKRFSQMISEDRNDVLATFVSNQLQDVRDKFGQYLDKSLGEDD